MLPTQFKRVRRYRGGDRREQQYRLETAASPKQGSGWREDRVDFDCLWSHPQVEPTRDIFSPVERAIIDAGYPPY